MISFISFSFFVSENSCPLKRVVFFTKKSMFTIKSWYATNRQHHPKRHLQIKNFLQQQNLLLSKKFKN